MYVEKCLCLHFHVFDISCVTLCANTQLHLCICAIENDDIYQRNQPSAVTLQTEWSDSNKKRCYLSCNCCKKKSCIQADDMHVEFRS